MGDKVTEHNIKKLLVCSGESEQFMNTEDFWKKKKALWFFWDIFGHIRKVCNLFYFSSW